MNVGEPGTDAHVAYLHALLAPYTRSSRDDIMEPEPAPAPETPVFVSPVVEKVLPALGATEPGDASVIDLRRRDVTSEAAEVAPAAPPVVEPIGSAESEPSRVPSPRAEDTVAAPASGTGRHARRDPPARPAADVSPETDEEASPPLIQRRSAQ